MREKEELIKEILEKNQKETIETFQNKFLKIIKIIKVQSEEEAVEYLKKVILLILSDYQINILSSFIQKKEGIEETKTNFEPLLRHIRRFQTRSGARVVKFMK